MTGDYDILMIVPTTGITPKQVDWIMDNLRLYSKAGQGKDFNLRLYIPGFHSDPSMPAISRLMTHLVQKKPPCEIKYLPGARRAREAVALLFEQIEELKPAEVWCFLAVGQVSTTAVRAAQVYLQRTRVPGPSYKLIYPNSLA